MPFHYFLFRFESFSKISSLVIEGAFITHLDMTNDLFARIGLNSDLVSRLEKLKIVNNTLQHINICSLEKEGVAVTTESENKDLIKCGSLSGLKSLDLRGNQLTGLEKFHLGSLKELKLSSKLNAFDSKKNCIISFWFAITYSVGQKSDRLPYFIL